MIEWEISAIISIWCSVTNDQTLLPEQIVNNFSRNPIVPQLSGYCSSHWSSRCGRSRSRTRRLGYCGSSVPLSGNLQLPPQVINLALHVRIFAKSLSDLPIIKIQILTRAFLHVWTPSQPGKFSRVDDIESMRQMVIESHHSEAEILSVDGLPGLEERCPGNTFCWRQLLQDLFNGVPLRFPPSLDPSSWFRPTICIYVAITARLHVPIICRILVHILKIDGFPSCSSDPVVCQESVALSSARNQNYQVA
jgi:hypothetical protein